MIGIGSIVKWAAIAGIVTSIGFGLRFAYNYHQDEIVEAVNQAKLEFAIERREAVDRREMEITAELEIEKEIIEVQLKVERERVTDLQRLLLIDHDLDRLLQKKPGLILTRVNKGTEEVLKELEAITQ